MQATGAAQTTAPVSSVKVVPTKPSCRSGWAYPAGWAKIAGQERRRKCRSPAPSQWRASTSTGVETLCMYILLSATGKR